MKRLLALSLVLLAAGSQATAEEHAPHPRLAVALLTPRGLPRPERAAGIEGLLSAVARRTAVETSGVRPLLLSPTDPRLFDHPLVVLSGGVAFEPFDEKELDAMRSYLSLGGMVLIDDTSGDAASAFAMRAREELSRALGGRAFEPLPREHALYRSYYLLDRAWGRLAGSADLSAIVAGGRAAVVYSANDLLGACARDELGHWALDVSPGGTEQRDHAIRMGVNVVLYALTLDYKEDLVHLPMILERRR